MEGGYIVRFAGSARKNDPYRVLGGLDINERVAVLSAIDYVRRAGGRLDAAWIRHVLGSMREIEVHTPVHICLVYFIMKRRTMIIVYCSAGKGTVFRARAMKEALCRYSAYMAEVHEEFGYDTAWEE